MKNLAVCFLAAMILCTVLFGCGGKGEEKEQAEKYAIEKEFHKGGAPITVRVKISDETLTIADLLRFVIEIEQEEGVKAVLPQLSELNFGQFLVKDYRKMRGSVDDDGASTIGTTYVLEPQLSGEYTIQPFEVKFTIEGELPKEGEEIPQHTLTTEAFKIEVKSLGVGDPRTADIKPIQGPVELPKKGLSRKRLITIIVATAVAACLIILVIIIGRRHKTVEIRRKVPAHVLALEALKKLREKQLIEQGLIKEFYFEISDILRHYIESRFGLTAPEQTTEEFLVSMSKDGFFSPNTQQLLGSFLEHCDLVKFARYSPATEEIQKTFSITRDFIEETQLEKKNGF